MSINFNFYFISLEMYSVISVDIVTLNNSVSQLYTFKVFLFLSVWDTQMLLSHAVNVLSINSVHQFLV